MKESNNANLMITLNPKTTPMQNFFKDHGILKEKTKDSKNLPKTLTTISYIFEKDKFLDIYEKRKETMRKLYEKEIQHIRRLEALKNVVTQFNLKSISFNSIKFNQFVRRLNRLGKKS